MEEMTRCQLCKLKTPFLMTIRYDHKIYSPMIESSKEYDSVDGMHISAEVDGLRVCVRCKNALEKGRIKSVLREFLVRCPICNRIQLNKKWCLKKSCYYNFPMRRVIRPFVPKKEEIPIPKKEEVADNWKEIKV